MNVTIDETLDGRHLSNFPLPDNLNEVVNSLRVPMFTLKDTNHSSRMMNYYSKKGLLLNETKTKGKRKLNGVQLIWLTILEDLFKTGVDQSVISYIKEYFETAEYFDVNNFNKYPYLEFIIALVVEFRSDLRLIVTVDGSFVLINYSIASNLYKESSFTSNTHISIPLFSKVQFVWKKIGNGEIQQRKVVFKQVKPDEETVLAALEQAKGPVDEIFIFLKEQKVPHQVKITERIDLKTIKSIGKFLRECKHCTIEIGFAQNIGEPTLLKRKQTIKLPEKG